jgi:hypothetical protein
MRALRIAGGVNLPAYAAAFLALAVDGIYLTVIAHQGNGGSRVAFVAGSLALAAVAVAAAESIGTVTGGFSASWAVGTLWVWTVLGALSIGLLIAPAGVLATTSLMRRQTPAAVVMAGIGLALLTAAAGLAWTAA